MSKNDMSEAVLASSMDAVSHSELLSYTDYLYLCDVSGGGGGGGCFYFKYVSIGFSVIGCVPNVSVVACVQWFQQSVWCVQNRPLTILIPLIVSFPHTCFYDTSR